MAPREGSYVPLCPTRQMLLATERNIRADVPGAEFESAVRAGQSALEGERFRRFIHEAYCPSCRLIVEAKDVTEA
jgi:hypothetical protein